jgi:hypothetical protein
VRLPDPERSYAVLIGVSAYRSKELPGLPSVASNLDGLAEILTDPALGGLPAGRCITLRDPVGVPAVYRALRRYATAAQDTLLVYFAGHGRIGMARNELFLSLADTDPDELPVTALRFDLIREVFADSPAVNRVLILDCCFSGRAIPDMSGPEETILGQVDIEGTYTLTATPGNEVALAPAGAAYTAFTGELLALVRAGIPGGPQFLTYASIYPRLLQTMTSRGFPRPRQCGTGTVSQLALARNPGYADPVPSQAGAAPVPQRLDARGKKSDAPEWSAGLAESNRVSSGDVVMALTVKDSDFGCEHYIDLEYKSACLQCGQESERPSPICTECGSPTTRRHRETAQVSFPPRPCYGKKVRIGSYERTSEAGRHTGDLYVIFYRQRSYLAGLWVDMRALWMAAEGNAAPSVGIPAGQWVRMDRSGKLKYRFRRGNAAAKL